MWLNNVKLLFWLHLIWVIQLSSASGALSIPPSLYWDGIDGNWSTFQIQIGTPGQTVRLLPGTSPNAANSIWTVIPQGCSAAVSPNINDCSDKRGYLFTSNASKTWSTERLSNGGLYSLNTDFVEGLLGYEGNAYYGFDAITLGISGSDMPTIENQLIAGYAASSFWLGSLGISPFPFNFTDLNSPIPSLLSTLREKGEIESTSWAYTAGAPYVDPPVFGSLTLGGYDESRINTSASLSAIPFGADFTRDLLLGIEAITYDGFGSSPLLSQGIYAFIDSMVPAMWLPVTVCQAFEKAFGLTWDDSSELYLLTEKQHSNLLAENPTFTFSITSELQSSKSVDIRIPYAALDLSIGPPLTNTTSYYFPIKRAESESKYTLGRAFLQEAYVVADYDRGQFQVSQALHPGTSVEQNIKVLYPPGRGPANGTKSDGSEDDSSISTGGIAGIAVGVAAVAISFAVLAWFCIRRRRKWRGQQQPDEETFHLNNYEPVAEKRGPNDAEMGTENAYNEMSGEGRAIHELGALHKFDATKSQTHSTAELPAGVAAVETDGTMLRRAEKDDRGGAPVELEAPFERPHDINVDERHRPR